MTPTHQCCETDKTQLKSKYDEFMYDCEEAIVAGLQYAAEAGLKLVGSTETRIEKALVEFRLKNDFETWQRGHIRP